MTEWEITYTLDRENFLTTTVSAPTYTMALLQFVIKFPNTEYSDARQVDG
jgi:hypothetical protein